MNMFSIIPNTPVVNREVNTEVRQQNTIDNELQDLGLPFYYYFDMKTAVILIILGVLYFCVKVFWILYALILPNRTKKFKCLNCGREIIREKNPKKCIACGGVVVPLKDAQNYTNMPNIVNSYDDDNISFD